MITNKIVKDNLVCTQLQIYVTVSLKPFLYAKKQTWEIEEKDREKFEMMMEVDEDKSWEEIKQLIKNRKAWRDMCIQPET